jgi:hypothetical protein
MLLLKPYNSGNPKPLMTNNSSIFFISNNIAKVPKNYTLPMAIRCIVPVVQNLVGSPSRHKQAEDLKPKICTSERKKPDQSSITHHTFKVQGDRLCQFS